MKASVRLPFVATVPRSVAVRIPTSAAPPSLSTVGGPNVAKLASASAINPTITETRFICVILSVCLHALQTIRRRGTEKTFEDPNRI
jgi:hypothetical protein